MAKRLRELYYITHLQNVSSILKTGILSHAEVARRQIPYTPVYDAGIVSWRKDRQTPDGRSLWEYANLYFRARNPMLYRVLKEKGEQEIVVLGVQRDVLDLEGVLVTTGNAARSETVILKKGEWKKYRNEILQGVDVKWWSEADGSKRRIMAEVLVPERIPPSMIRAIYVADNNTRKIVYGQIEKEFPSAVKQIAIIPEPQMFFLPRREIPLLPRLKLIEGDMFFSPLQTLTISVNTVGVMGKGLASRAKYQFPDAYVVYQDACRKKWILPGKPYLYKREVSLEAALADDVAPLLHPNKRTWFLFFPTKRHWRENSRLEDIQNGLRWIVANYKREGIESLALPALGCGLGGLSWAEVGPLMCQSLSRLDIEVHIHLPLEGALPAEQLEKAFLLG
ncbi:MAG: DUF4433 domain-containing protein [Caldilineae bacterium]|nr:MAG: DUF4433 domain-containing protein [Caldilineae bacterium]